MSTENKQDEQKEEPISPVIEEVKPKRSFLDFNFSWIMLLIDLAIIFSFGTYNLQTVNSHGLTLNPTIYICIVVIFSLLANFLVYTVFKLIGGYIGGYQLTKLMLFGFTIIFRGHGHQKYVTFKIGNILDFHMIMTPKKETTNHFWFLLMGMGGYLMLNIIVIVVALMVVTISNPIVFYSLLFSISYGFIVALYQLFPCRLDYVNDCFVLIKTRKEDDLKAYENELKNIRHSLLGEDFEIIKFENYASFYKSHVIYYQYMDALMKDDLDTAVDCLEKTKEFTVWYTDEFKMKITAERLFVLLSSESFDDAEKFYSTQKRDLQQSILSSGDLSSFRTALMVEGIINNMRDDAIHVISAYESYCQSHANVDSTRITMEKKLFNRSLEIVNKARPDWNLKLNQVDKD